MDREKIPFSVAPSMFFMLACLFLYFSGLTIKDGISFENRLIGILLNSLKTTDLLSAIGITISYLFFNALLPLLPFFFLVASGFLAIYFSIKNLDLDFFLIFQGVASLIVLAIVSLSVVILFVLAGLFVCSVFLIRNFEQEETVFKTLRKIVSRNLQYTNLFLLLGLFTSIMLDQSSYVEAFHENNVNFVTGFIPNATNIQNAISGITNATLTGPDGSDGFKTVFTKSYNSYANSNQTIANSCQPIKNATIVELGLYQDAWTNVTYNESTRENITSQLNQTVSNILPVIGVVDQASPLLFAIVAFSLLETIKPFVSLLFAGVGSMISPKLKETDEKLEEELHSLNQDEEESLKSYYRGKFSKEEFRHKVKEIKRRRNEIQSMLRRIKKVELRS